jgi:hypothetical protein
MSTVTAQQIAALRAATGAGVDFHGPGPRTACTARRYVGLSREELAGQPRQAARGARGAA